MPRMVRNIYHRKDGRYEGRYIKDYDGDGGKARYGYVFARSYAEVKERLQTAKSEPPVQIDQPAPRLLPDAIDAYLDSICGSVKQSTLCVYRRQADNIIKPVLGGYSLSQLTSALIQDFIDTQCENGLSAVTVQSVFGLLRSVLKFAGVEVPCVVLPKREKHEAEFFTVEEQKRLESTALRVSEFDHLAIMLCLYTGIRVGELCGLMWEDIDLAGGIMQIRRTVQRIQSDTANSKTSLVYSAPKSDTSVRTIPLSAVLIALLQRHKNRRDCDFVLSHNGNPVEPRNIQHHFKRLLNIAEIKDVGFHTTRHTFATRALESGFDVKTLSEILGHVNATITLKQYAHSATEHKRSCMESLSKLWVSESERGQNCGQHDEKTARCSG